MSRTRIESVINEIKNERLKSFMICIYKNDMIVPTAIEESCKVIIEMEKKISPPVIPHNEIIEDEDSIDPGIVIL